jgi:hypothetical protein
MRGFADFDQAWKAMTQELVAAWGNNPPPTQQSEPRFRCGEQVWWVAGDTQPFDPDLCESGVIFAENYLHLEGTDHWGWQYGITVHIDSPSGDWLHYALAWEYELLERLVAHVSNKPSQPSKN